ncbi:MAG TPA: nickel pincer cofactor biosynthesis protein LarB [Actinomycetota bacterium]|nr:nickel pincer cofactor biosynthesis protein LarB [Actinomycetota bacterium]
MTSRREIDELLAAVAEQRIEPAAAADALAGLPFRDLGFARVDTHRELRQGAPEVVLGEGKTVEQAVAIAVALDEAGASSVLVTRAPGEMRDALRTAIPDAREHELARAVWVQRREPDRRGRVLIVSAGTSDGSVVHEARIRAELLGAIVTVHEDVGVAGLHRLSVVLPDLERADCVVVVAGMDGALASVIGGLAAAPVIGVPTSVGYGSADGGRTALNAMLCSCADGLAVVGIDDGLGAGSVAARIARRAAVP